MSHKILVYSPLEIRMSKSEMIRAMLKPSFTKKFIESIVRGIDDAESGKVYSKEEIHTELEKARSSRKQ